MHWKLEEDRQDRDQRHKRPPMSTSRQHNQFRLYQTDFTVVSTGKVVASSKRRVRWKFGFSNMQALQDGQVGMECRGEEHDITFIWSLTSGKRLILADGHEVHYSLNRESSFEFSWTMRGNHVLKVIGHAFQPTGNPGYTPRQYDLLVDGQSFFHMPKVYELGVQGYQPKGNFAGGPGGNAPSSSTRAQRPYNLSTGRYQGPEVPRDTREEEAALQQAIAKSLEDSKRHLGNSGGYVAAPPAFVSQGRATGRPVVSRGAEDLLDLLDFDAAHPATSPVSTPSANVIAENNSQPTYSYDDPFAPKPPPAVSPSDHILGVYGVNASSAPVTQAVSAPAPVSSYLPAPSVPTQPALAPPANYYQPPPVSTTVGQPNYGYNAAPVPTTQPGPAPLAPGGNLYVDTNYQEPFEQAPAQPDGTDELTKKMASLVNLTDLNSPAGNSSYNPFDLSSGASVSNNAKTSGNTGPAPSLKEMSKTTVKPNQGKGPVMKAPPSSAMVMHHQQHQGYGGYNNYGPPPTQQQPGFGVQAQFPQQPMTSPTYQYGQQQPPMPGQQQPMTSPTYSHGQQQQGQGFGQQQPQYPPQQF